MERFAEDCLCSTRSLAAAALPDPMCKTGVVSLKLGENPQSCCAGYCGECSDYKTCESVRGQDSKNACCATAVYDMRCGGKAAANVCLKKCSEAVPPCIMDKDEIVIKDPKRNAADNCTQAHSHLGPLQDFAVPPSRFGSFWGPSPDLLKLIDRLCPSDAAGSLFGWFGICKTAVCCLKILSEVHFVRS